MSRSHERGFSLIEMMAVLLIIAILSTFAYPSYREAKLKSARAEGRSALLRLMQQQERYYTEHRRYRLASDEGGGGDGDDDRNGSEFRWFSGASASASAYRLEAAACESVGSDCLLLRAIPANGLTDPACDVLTLDSAGRQGASGSGACR